MDNLEIAIYQKLNELAARHDLQPCDFRAKFEPDDKGLDDVLTFVWPAEDNAAMASRYRLMLFNIGISRDENALVGSGDRIYNAIEEALKRIPTKRPRTR